MTIGRLTAPWIAAVIASQAFPASAGETAMRPDLAVKAVQEVALPGTGFVLRLDGAGRKPGRPPQDLVMAIAAWLSHDFGLPPMQEPPAVALASPARMMGLRYRDVPSDRDGEVRVAAIYDDKAKTIWLPLGWSAATPRDSSVLVHEMVHHMQNAAGMTFACPQEREKMAYEAQAQWLALFGSSLDDFGIDPFTRLVRTNCSY